MKIRELIIFVVGVGVGIGASYNIIKKKHDEILEEEIASVKESYSKNNKESDEVTEEKEPEQKEIASVKETYNKLTKEYSESNEENCSEIYEISYDDFGEEGYEEIELTYYIDDETLTDDADEPMEELDIISSIGSIDILDGCKDGEYIYIRNKEKEIDYSIAISENRRE